ncbi:histidinol phosphate phosphatase HisJ family protein [Penicillium citrinum]|uniref:Histidinol phosphate phosphatase HisJ family protein n=1 Tax=Penicillium citrinum TaxID=5077 RepID=A0A9W9NWQ1_PENCI|nr:histidinol phosphate phosphatase HisJ family protein [Penicillium citrinum]KAJ5227377.1 histidinol phosphate phosphatase HisJ family protein [Penicillium citrinum]
MVDLDQIDTALSLAPPNLTEINIEADVELGGHDIDYPEAGIKESFKKLINLHQVKKLQTPFAFLIGFVEDTTKRLQNSLPRNIEFLTLTYNLTEQEGQYSSDMPEWDWEDENIFELLRSWLNDWESCTPCLRGIRIVQIPRDDMGMWDSSLIDRLSHLSVQTGIHIELSPID